LGGGDPTLTFGGVLGLAQHPVTGVLYAIRKTSDPLKRELVTIQFAPDFLSADTTLVGSLNMQMTSMVFVAPPPPRIDSTTRSGSELTLTWSGGTPPYQVQTRSNLTTGTWSNVGGTTTQTTATVPIAGTAGYFRVASQ
jgi:hypothetical protein